MEDSNKIFFAISYLRGIALEYFKPFINKPDINQDFDFIEDWLSFVQKLSNIFRFYLSKDDDKDTIVLIPFSPNSKVVEYFIYFAKYQNRIHWDDWALCKVVKDFLSIRISEELCYSKKDTLTFEGFKQAILKINNGYWKYIQNEKDK